MIIKVCGMRDANNIHEIESLGVDIIGLVFYPKSPRYVSMVSSNSGIIPDMPADRTTYEWNGKRKVRFAGVFVDDLPQNIITRIYNFGLHYVQLHGEETPEMISNMKRTVILDIRKELKIIKTISISEKADISKCRQYEGIADMFLFDTKCESMGGCGRKFDWSILSSYKGETPFILSGGIGADDIERIKAVSHPKFYGIDINSKFETEPGIKDTAAVAAFIKELRQ